MWSSRQPAAAAGHAATHSRARKLHQRRQLQRQRLRRQLRILLLLLWCCCRIYTCFFCYFQQIGDCGHCPYNNITVTQHSSK
jgi:hypothetical protein